MTAAFSNLSEVTELGLSLDSGLGWLVGPDVSDRARIFNEKEKVFGRRHTLPDAAARERAEAWRTLSIKANVPFVQHIILRYEEISKRLSVPPTRFYEMVKENLTMRVIDDMRCMNSVERAWHLQSGFGELLHSLGVSNTQLPGEWFPAPNATAHKHNIQPEPTWVTHAQVVLQASSAIEACLQAASEEFAMEEEYAALVRAREERAAAVPIRKEDPTENEEDPEDEDAIMLDEDSDVEAEESESEDDEAAAEDEEEMLEDSQWQSSQELEPAFKAPPLIYQGIDFNTAPNHVPGFRICSSGSNPFLSEALIPNSLTTPQKEWLLETEWAQRAFLASYTLAVMDNVTTFQNVRTFSITKLSSRYLAPLQRDDFWGALPSLDTVTIVVSPDWRDIIKEHAGYVADFMIAPSDASGALYRLVEQCIAPLENIKTLTLGFVGGGEHAPGIFARNKHVLPAPIMEQPSGQLEIASPMKTLHLPYVEDLTFTNCWFSPPALRTFVIEARQASLHTLRLDSVSLTAMPTIQGHNPVHVNFNAPVLAPPAPFFPPPAPMPLQAAMHAALGPAVQAGPLPQPPPGAGPVIAGPATPAPVITWLTTDPRPGSWTDTIDHITPGATIAAQRAVHNAELEAPPPRDNGTLRRLEFASCGYVRLCAGLFGQDELGTPPVRERNSHLARRAQDLERVMMSSGSDQWVGRIQSFMKAEEREGLEGAFGLEFGWGEDARRWEAVEDDETMGGTGRFAGWLVEVVDGEVEGMGEGMGGERMGEGMGGEGSGSGSGSGIGSGSGSGSGNGSE